MANTSPTLALQVVQRVERMCGFIGHPAMKAALEQVPVTMPHDLASLGLETPFWVGLGTVALWAALDGFAERRGIKRNCRICKRNLCIWARFDPPASNEGQILKELDDLRHLYAHNYAGEADAEYFARKRHVFKSSNITQLTCGAVFDGHRTHLDLTHLRAYSNTVRSVLEHFS
jgi:hypothetical protein